MAESSNRYRLGDREFVLIGTAHVSEDSVRDVEATIRAEQPDRICLEIDQARLAAMSGNSSREGLDLSQILKQGRGLLLLANLVLSAFQKRLGSDLGINPGAEMARAVSLARELGIPFTLCDREARITLRRAWAGSGVTGKIRIISILAGSLLAREKLSREDIEQLKQKTTLDSLLEELSDKLPAAKTVLLDERDRFLATRIYNTTGNKVVVIAGAGHIRGIIHNLEKLHRQEISSEISQLQQVPQPGKIHKVLPWIISVILLGLIGGGFFIKGPYVGRDMFLVWWLVNGALSALGALAALAHPAVVLLAFCAAPVTSLNPLLAAGVLTGILQYRLKKPMAKDFENLGRDITSARGFYKNRITRVLLVFLFSSLGSTTGTFIGFPLLVSLLAGV